jgi:hypothetical protein
MIKRFLNWFTNYIEVYSYGRVLNQYESYLSDEIKSQIQENISKALKNKNSTM